jgi:hypothetical protein
MEGRLLGYFLGLEISRVSRCFPNPLWRKHHSTDCPAVFWDYWVMGRATELLSGGSLAVSRRTLQS